MQGRKLRLVQGQCPGDLAVMTMAIDSLHRQYPSQFVTGVSTNHDELFDHHPLVAKLQGDDVANVLMHCDRINECHIPFHFGTAFCDTLGDALGLPLRLQVSRPSLYLSAEERASSVLAQKASLFGPYAVINAGYKDDYKTKWAGTNLYQSVVDAHRDRITFVQVGAKAHHHPKLSGVVDLIGRTTLRELVRLCAGAEFGVGGITAVGHFCAAFEKPYVCLVGGREPLSWIGYPTQISLNTHGLLSCCRTRACWKSCVSSPEVNKNCVLPVVDDAGCTVPQCLAMLKGAAIDAVDVLLDGVQGVHAITAGRTLISEDRLHIIRDTVRAVAHLPGDMAELGCFRGGSAKLIATTAPAKLLHVFDGFEGGIPEDDTEPSGHKAGEFASRLEDVRQFLVGCDVRLYPGAFPATADGLDDVRLCFAHLDFDTYQSTRAALLWLWPRMVDGGVIVLDDYGWHRCEGVKRAVAEVLPGVSVQVTNGMQAMVRKGSCEVFGKQEQQD